MLLGKRAKKPNFGNWILPGGGVNFCEKLENTLMREILEETNLEVKINGFFKFYELISSPDEHRVIFYFNAEYVNGELKHNSDLSEANFFNKSEIRELSNQGKISSFVEEVLKDAQWL